MFSAVLDANVLYPLYFRDILLYANLQGRSLYAPIWSDEILAEVGRNLVANQQVAQPNVDQMIAGMKRAYPDAVRNPPSFDFYLPACVMRLHFAHDEILWDT